MNLEIPDDQSTTLFSYLGIGVLYAILKEARSPEVGIWTMGLPKITTFLRSMPSIPAQLCAIYESSDELSALAGLNPEAYYETMIQLFEKLLAQLSTTTEDTTWMHWVIRR